MIYIVIADYYQVWEDPNWLAGETPPYYKTRDYACNVENEVSELIDYMHLRNKIIFIIKSLSAAFSPFIWIASKSNSISAQTQR